MVANTRDANIAYQKVEICAPSALLEKVENREGPQCVFSGFVSKTKQMSEET